MIELAHTCQDLTPQQIETSESPTPTPPNNTIPSPVKHNDPTNNSSHQDILINKVQ